ncbi:Flp family type IVb pilin [Lederbergia panacisoli]|uniref:Flp family type IVb pilin n=1 Tax=Lederbergia panacisoli TaxID=1255251 RepID=UPI00214B3D45|nr:Flp family type IVb pilin [Lederbergia panacisoli]MCR2823181.1 Flp family type IVb pilin [Lederbergia panacisoli]
MKNFLTNFFKEEEGQGMAEYALVLGIVAVGVVGILVFFGESIVEKLTEIAQEFSGKTYTP